MNLFHIIEDAQVILRSRSNPNVSWESMEPEFPKARNGDPVFLEK